MNPIFDRTPLDDETLAIIGRAIANIIARGHSVEIVPLIPKAGNPVSYSVSVPTVGFLGAVPLAELHDLLADALRECL